MEPIENVEIPLVTGPRISVFGKMRSGKDTVAKIIMSGKYGPFQKVAYGDKLKEIYHKTFGYSQDVKDREGYQWFGQTMRSHYEDVWVDHVEREIQLIESSFYSATSGIVITDMRQPNEYEQLKERGFYMVKVKTPDDIRFDRITANGERLDPALLNHETETHVDGFRSDIIIVNDGTLEDLEYKVGILMAAISYTRGLVK